MLLRFFSSGFRSIKGAVDWRKKGALAPVKNQGCSGVCTLMACIASIESIFQIKSPSGDLIELSSQHMLNCIARQYSRHKGVSGPRIDAVIDGKGLQKMEEQVARQPIVGSVDASTWKEIDWKEDKVYSGPPSTDLNHAIVIAGYGTHDDGTDFWLVRNSWGTGFGDGGY
ncbi:cysteine protease, partial [Trifolium pratense]